MPSVAPVVFLELLGTVGFEAVRPGGPRLDRFRVRPDLRGILEELAPHARIGVISSDPEIDVPSLSRVLAMSGVMPLFTAAPVVADPRLEATRSRTLAATDPSAWPERVLYVGLDATLRLAAVRRGWRAAPHPRLIRPLLANDSLAFLRLDGRPSSWRSALVGRPVVPLLDARAPDAALYVVAARSAIDGLRAMHDAVHVLPGDPEVASLQIEAVDPPSGAGGRSFAEFVERLRGDERIAFEWGNSRDLVLAVPGDVPPGALHPPVGRHGHTRVGHPDPLLLEPVAATAPLVGRGLMAQELAAFGQIDASRYQKVLTSVLAASPGPSRNIGHVGNVVATDWSTQTLLTLCGQARACPFPFNGGTLRNVEAEIPGTSAELVIVAAHLDSTAAFSPGYLTREASHPAPGADDDASGIAAVLTAAERLRTLADETQPIRTIRFVLFNAEEYGRGGSQHYAEELEAIGAPVAAMIQADMIGWRDPGVAARRFEIHGTGPADHADLVDATAQLTALVRDAARQVAPALEAELYPLPGSSSDPATHRSDHASFLSRGWPACLVSENFFVEASGSSQDAGNPNYHTESDTQASLDLSYAADIARTIAASAWILATAGTPPVISGGLPRRDEMPASTEPIRRTSVMPNPGPAPTKYLVEFLAQWIRDEPFRCRVLHREIDALTQYGLNADQRDVLLSLDPERILKRIRVEMKQFLGIDLDRLRSEVGGPVPQVPAPETIESSTATGQRFMRSVSMLMAEQSFYGQGRVHLRRTHPLHCPSGSDQEISVFGQGFDATPEIRFELEVGEPPKLEIVTGEVLDIHCDVDVYQKVLTRVNFEVPGQWMVRGRNDSEGDPWSVERVILTVDG